MTWTDGILTVPGLEKSRAVKRGAGLSKRKRVGNGQRDAGGNGLVRDGQRETGGNWSVRDGQRDAGGTGSVRNGQRDAYWRGRVLCLRN